MRVKEWYVKGMGCFCYDRSGVTFPKKIPFEFPEYGRWERQFGWPSQPEVFTFRATEGEMREFNASLPHGLIVRPHWNTPSKGTDPIDWYKINHPEVMR